MSKRRADEPWMYRQRWFLYGALSWMAVDIAYGLVKCVFQHKGCP